MTTFIAWVTLAATVAVALVAIEQVVRERRREQHRERAASARISTLAFLLRRELGLWIGENDTPGKIDAWLRGQNVGDLAQEIRPARHLIVQMMDILPDAPADRAAPLRAACVHLLEGVRRLELLVAQGRPRDPLKEWDWIHVGKDAEQDLRDCMTALENGLIEPALLNAEGISRRTRQLESPFGELEKED